MKVGTVGGSLEINPSVRINHRLLGSPNASELAGIMGVIGLAQNFAACAHFRPTAFSKTI